MANGRGKLRSSMRLAKTLFTLACCAALFAFEAKAAPNILETGVIRYLGQFGYLPPSNPNRARSMTEESLSKAISEFQTLMGINVTGITDSETTRLMKIPRCGLKDTAATSRNGRSKRYAILGSPWQKKRITYRISRYSSKLNPRAVDQVIAKAFAVWAEHVDLDFRPMSYGQVDIEIRFEHGFHGNHEPFDGSGNILAHAFPPGPGIGGDVHFDDDESWTIGTGYGIDLLQIAVHEIGHALGLAHSNALGSIMFPTYRDNMVVRLARDDIAGIEALYAEEDKNGDYPLIHENPWINWIFPLRLPYRPSFRSIQPVRD